MTRWLLVLFLSLTVGQAAAQPTPPAPSAPATVMVSFAEYRNGPPVNEPVVIVASDGGGRAMLIFAAGHGGIPFVMAGGRWHVVLDTGDDSADNGLLSDAIPLIVRSRQGEDMRRLVPRLVRSRLEVSPGVTETVAGIEGRVYSLALIEDGRRTASFQLVLSTDPRLADTGREILRFYDELRVMMIEIAGVEPQPYTAIRALLAQGTPIRVGDNFRLREFGRREALVERMGLKGPVLDAAHFAPIFRERVLYEHDPAYSRPESTGNETVDEDSGNSL